MLGSRIDLVRTFRGQFSSRLREEGERVRGENLQKAETVDGRFEATFDDGALAEIDWSSYETNGQLRMFCFCSRFRQMGRCAHVWAAILEADSGGAGPVRESKAAPPTREWEFRLRLVESAVERASTPPAPSARKEEIFWVVTADQWATREEGEPVAIEVYRRQARSDGRMGVVKGFPLDRDRIRAELPPGEDRDVLEMLQALRDPWIDESWAEGLRSLAAASRDRRFAVPAELLPLLLERIARTGRLLWRRTENERPHPDRVLAWQGPPAWRPRLRLEPMETTTGYRLAGELFRSDEVRAIEDALAVLEEGLVVFPGVVAPLQTGRRFPWLTSLRRSGPIDVPTGDAEEMVRRLLRVPDLPVLDLPDDVGPEVFADPPLPRLLVLRPDTGDDDVRVDLDFRYGDIEIEASDPRLLVPIAGVDAWVRRDRGAEREATDRLEALELQRDRDGEGWTVALGRLGDVVRELDELGWRIEAEGARVRPPGAVRMGIASGTDWLDLHGDIDFGDRTAALPTLLEAARRRAGFVRLDDGTFGLVPEAWVERLRALGEVASGPGEDDGLRFRAFQASFLEALFETEPDVAPVGLEVWSARLRALGEPGEEVEPEGFVGDLRPYQRHGLAWMSRLIEVGAGGCLADDMGLGKTVQVLALLQNRRNEDPDRVSLVVAPRSLLFNWMEEAKRFTPQLRAERYAGPGREALLEELKDIDLLVTTYGTLRRDVGRLRDHAFDLAVLDEAQAIKNAVSQTARAARSLRAENRLALSGTPVENHLGELWSLFEFLNPGMLGASQKLGDLFGQGELGQKELRTLARAVGPFVLRRTKEQVLRDLPEKTEQTLHCELEGAQARLYREVRDHYRARLARKVRDEGIRRSRFEILEALLRLRQVACHPGLLDKERRDEPSAKLDLLLERLFEVVEEGHKALVFSQFTSFLSLVRDRLEPLGIRYEYLDGRTRARQERVARFQEDPDIPVFLISLKAGGTGLNLTAADYVFLLDPWWNPAVEAQAIDRAHRIGRELPVFAYRLVARETIEERILELQDRKRELADAILAGERGPLGDLTAEDLDDLLA